MNYELEVVSQLPQFNGKALKPWFVDGIDTVGVWGDEPFELVFRNRTAQKVQVRLSLDGTDVLTGKKAHTNTDNEGMWVVDAWGTMSLKAWPETNQKGRTFVFGKEGNSVAAHTHGDMSSKGIIAAAVFAEGYKPYVPSYDRFKDVYFQGGGYGGSYGLGVFGGALPGVFSETIISSNAGDMTKGVSLNSPNNGPAARRERIAESAPAVGAGQEVMQKIGQAQGLVTPVLDRVVRVRYIWWDDLEAKLINQGFVRPSDGHPTGFPGDRERPLANLGTTPTTGQAPKRPPIQIQRFA